MVVGTLIFWFSLNYLTDGLAHEIFLFSIIGMCLGALFLGAISYELIHPRHLTAVDSACVLAGAFALTAAFGLVDTIYDDKISSHRSDVEYYRKHSLQNSAFLKSLCEKSTKKIDDKGCLAITQIHEFIKDIDILLDANVNLSQYTEQNDHNIRIISCADTQCAIKIERLNYYSHKAIESEYYMKKSIQTKQSHSKREPDRMFADWIGINALSYWALCIFAASVAFKLYETTVRFLKDMPR
jgi:hypothetical protein